MPHNHNQLYAPHPGHGIVEPEPELTDPEPDAWDLTPYARLLDFCLQAVEEGLYVDR